MSVTTLQPAPLSAWERSVRADALLILVRAKLLVLAADLHLRHVRCPV